MNSPGETKGTFSPENTDKHLSLGGPAVSAEATEGCRRRLLLCACPSEDREEWPKPRAPEHLVTAAVTPATHAGYAATWFALSAAGAAMCVYI